MELDCNIDLLLSNLIIYWSLGEGWPQHTKYLGQPWFSLANVAPYLCPKYGIKCINLSAQTKRHATLKRFKCHHQDTCQSCLLKGFGSTNLPWLSCQMRRTRVENTIWTTKHLCQIPWYNCIGKVYWSNLGELECTLQSSIKSKHNKLNITQETRKDMWCFLVTLHPWQWTFSNIIYLYMSNIQHNKRKEHDSSIALNMYKLKHKLEAGASDISKFDKCVVSPLCPGQEHIKIVPVSVLSTPIWTPPPWFAIRIQRRLLPGCLVVAKEPWVTGCLLWIRVENSVLTSGSFGFSPLPWTSWVAWYLNHNATSTVAHTLRSKPNFLKKWKEAIGVTVSQVMVVVFRQHSSSLESTLGDGGAGSSTGHWVVLATLTNFTNGWTNFALGRHMLRSGAMCLIVARKFHGDVSNRARPWNGTPPILSTRTLVLQLFLSHSGLDGIGVGKVFIVILFANGIGLFSDQVWFFWRQIPWVKKSLCFGDSHHGHHFFFDMRLMEEKPAITSWYGKYSIIFQGFIHPIGGAVASEMTFILALLLSFSLTRFLAFQLTRLLTS